MCELERVPEETDELDPQLVAALQRSGFNRHETRFVDEDGHVEDYSLNGFSVFAMRTSILLFNNRPREDP